MSISGVFSSLSNGLVIEKQKETNLHYGRYFLRKGFVRSVEDFDENIVKPLAVDRNGEDYFLSSQDNIISLIYRNEIGIKGFAYSPRATQEERDAEFEKIATAFLETSKRSDFADEKIFFVFVIVFLR